MRMTREEWTVEYHVDRDYVRIGDLVTISNTKCEVTTIVCADNTADCSECCVKRIFGLVTCKDVPVYCMRICFKLVEDIL